MKKYWVLLEPADLNSGRYIRESLGPYDFREAVREYEAFRLCKHRPVIVMTVLDEKGNTL